MDRAEYVFVKLAQNVGAWDKVKKVFGRGLEIVSGEKAKVESFMKNPSGDMKYGKETLDTFRNAMNADGGFAGKKKALVDAYKNDKGFQEGVKTIGARTGLGTGAVLGGVALLPDKEK